MQYLKCDHCGYYNEVKGGYLTFCSNCNKKLENNFNDWKKRNEGKTLDDYKKMVCVSGEQIINSQPAKKSDRKKYYWLLFVVVFAVAFGSFYVLGQKSVDALMSYFHSEKTSKEMLHEKWVRKTYGHFGLSLETPDKLTEQEIPVPENVKRMIDQMEAFSYQSSKSFFVMVNTIKYKPVIGHVNLQGAADGSVNKMKMQTGVTDFKYKEDHVTKNGMAGFIQNGSYKKDGVGVSFINAGYLNGLILYQVLIAYDTSDKVGDEVAHRVFNSIEIKPVQ